MKNAADGIYNRQALLTVAKNGDAYSRRSTSPGELTLDTAFFGEG